MSPVVWANARPPAAAPTTAIASSGTKNLRNLIDLLLCCFRRGTGLSLSQSFESQDEREKSTDTGAFQSNQTANRQAVAANSKLLQLEGQGDFRASDRTVSHP